MWELVFKRKNKVSFICAVLSILQLTTVTNGKLFPYGASEGDEMLPNTEDDNSSPEIRLKTPIVLYGQQHSSAYVNQNGLLSFSTDIPVFVNMEFPLDYASIAALYADVDIRVVGSVHYRESQDEEIIERARTLFGDHFTSATNFIPSSVFIATWDVVGHFDRKSDKWFKTTGPQNCRSDLDNEPLSSEDESTSDGSESDDLKYVIKRCKRLLNKTKVNTFQIVIATDGGDSYVAFIYDNIEWIQGTGKNPSMPDAKAQAGLISGSGPFYELKGSGTDQVSTLHMRSNVGEDGLWSFHIGRVTRQIEEPDLTVGLASSEMGSTCAASAITHCHSQANCIDYEPGFCCRCSNGFFGNGHTCLQDEIPLRMNGKVKGVINGIGLEDSDLFAYILPQDGRAYTAIAKIPERLGYDLQTVIVLGTTIGWLFSTSTKDTPNGFMLTGGIMNYTAEMDFQQTGQKVQVHQTFQGLDVFSHLKVDTRVHGTIPLVPVGKTIEVNNIRMELTRVSPGKLRSTSSHSYTVEGTSVENPFRVEQTFEYEECPWASPVPPELETMTMKIGRNYIVYDLSQEIVRYAITSKVMPVPGEDPCKENKDKCGPNSSCVVEGDEFKCICDRGFEEQYRYRDNEEVAPEVPQCVDIDECQIGLSTCDVAANCINSLGSFSCVCPPGQSGDGFICEKILTCQDVDCGPHAECIQYGSRDPECKCLPGFYGDGLFCYEHTGVDILPGPGGQPDCRQIRNLCDIFAECVYSPDSNSHICNCRPGYQGDGLTCHRIETETCDIENNCDPMADCRFDEQLNEYTCVCRPGYNGDGYICTRSSGFPDLYPGQEPSPICILNSCSCPAGFEYNDLRARCQIPTSTSTEMSHNCLQDPVLCDPNASCLYQSGSYVCVCNLGFSGDGSKCSPQDFCTTHSECSPFGECAYNDFETRYSCRCRDGFTGDGISCTPETDVGCDVLRNCDENAQCNWDPATSKYLCQCSPGFLGNGMTCYEDSASCSVLNNCAEKAECQFDSENNSYKCVCFPGYEGDGYNCRSTVPCYQDSSICSPNAQCLPDRVTREWKCHCNTGYFGDGQECNEIAKRTEDYLIVTKGMSLIKVPLNGDKPEPLLVEPFQTSIGIDIDCPNQKIYWSDVATRAIKVGNFNGSERENFLDDDIGSPEGLSVDWVSQNLYWTDSLKDTVEVANLKTKQRKVLVSTGLVNPRGIAVFPQRGRLFWSDWNREYPKIEVAGLDGQGREILVGEGLSLPNSLVVDPAKEELCWADAGTHQIECVGIDGRGRKVYISKINYPFGLAMGNNMFYWSDWETKKVESASIKTGKLGDKIEVSLGGLGKLYGVVFVPSECPYAYSPCEYNPCGDSRICLPNLRGGKSCICADDDDSSCQDLL